MPGEAFGHAAQRIIVDSLGEMRRGIEGTTTEARNWRPDATEMNSLAVPAVHAHSSTREWLCIAYGLALPERDRDSEFEAVAGSPDSLLQSIEAIGADCRTLLQRPANTEWSEPLPDASEPNNVSAAWALLHGVEHRREHLGQMSLTRQIWEQAAGR